MSPAPAGVALGRTRVTASGLYLVGSSVVISGVISRAIWVISIATLIATHEPSSRSRAFGRCRLLYRVHADRGQHLQAFRTHNWGEGLRL